MWLKIAGICLVIAGCGGWGFSWAFVLKERIALLQVFSQSLMLFKNQIVSYRLTIPEAAEEISYRVCLREVADFYRELAAGLKDGNAESGEGVWRAAAERTLRGEDAAIIRELGAFIGVMDDQVRVRALDGCIRELEERVRYLKQTAPERVRRTGSRT